MHFATVGGGTVVQLHLAGTPKGPLPCPDHHFSGRHTLLKDQQKLSLGVGALAGLVKGPGGWVCGS